MRDRKAAITRHRRSDCQPVRLRQRYALFMEMPLKQIQLPQPGVPNKLARTVGILAVLAALISTGLWKALWLNHALTHYPAFDRGMNDPSAASFFLLLGCAVPCVVLIIAVLVGRSGRPAIEKLLTIGKIGCLVAILPWFLLMVTGISV